MEPFAWIVLATVAVVFIFLIFSRFSPEIILLSGLAVLLILGGETFTVADGLIGFSDEGMLAIGVLFMVAAAIRETGGVWYLVNMLLGRPKSTLAAQSRIMFPVMSISGFMNNTPLVAVLLPVVNDWAKKLNMPVSKLLIPLSYSAILGGLCTIIGTSTNLIVAKRIQAETGYSLGFFEISAVGLPIALFGVGFILLTSKWLLPDRTPAMAPSSDLREYVLEMKVDPASPLVGKSIEQAGLRHLDGVYLMEIDREGEIIPAVKPKEKLQADDHLIFVGIVNSVVDLHKIPGLKPATDQLFKLNAPPTDRVLVEAVVSHTSPLVGKSVREGRFRTKYEAVVIAVARHGERINKKIGDIVLQAGDTLLIEGLPSFLERHRDSRDFYLVSRIEGYTPPRFDKAWLSLLILIVMVLFIAVAKVNILLAALIAAGAMFVTGCCSLETARRSLDGRVLLSIAAALGIGNAMKESGAAEAVVNAVFSLGIENPLVALAMLYFVTMVASEFLTNNAAAVLMFPFVVPTAQMVGADYLPFAIGVMIASSAAFATPIGYQTNLMVFGPGGYRFSDFIRIGLPLDLTVWASAMIIIPYAFPFGS